LSGNRSQDVVALSENGGKKKAPKEPTRLNLPKETGVMGHLGDLKTLKKKEKASKKAQGAKDGEAGFEKVDWGPRGQVNQKSDREGSGGGEEKSRRRLKNPSDKGRL